MGLISLKHLSVALLLFMVSAVTSGDGPKIQISKMALVTFEGNVDLEASASQVWQALTAPDKVQSWCPYWKSAKASEPLDAVGRTITYMDSWGNGGKSVVLYAEKNKELRIAHVPNDGSYVCQAKFQLQPKGAMTTVFVTEQYSDALDVPTDRDTAAKSKDEILGYMTALKTTVQQSMNQK